MGGQTSVAGLETKTLPHIERREKTSWQRPRVRPEHESMMATMLFAQSYIRDTDCNVLKTRPGGACALEQLNETGEQGPHSRSRRS